MRFLLLEKDLDSRDALNLIFDNQIGGHRHAATVAGVTTAVIDTPLQEALR